MAGTSSIDELTYQRTFLGAVPGLTVFSRNLKSDSSCDLGQTTRPQRGLCDADKGGGTSTKVRPQKYLRRRTDEASSCPTDDY
jgi:hypothetical protein